MAFRSLWCFFFVILVFLASEEKVVHVDGRKCDSPSHKFKGTCLRDENCANVCLSEGFTGGRCKGFRARCFCEKECS